VQLNAKDIALIRELRNAGVLENTKGNEIGNKHRFVAVACADGDRFPELYDFHRGHCDDGVCSHLPLRNGGALVLAPSSPIATRGNLPHGECCLYEINESCELKQTKEVVLYGHFPCAAAIAYNISLLDALKQLVEAKDTVRERIKGAKVSLFFHVDYDGHRQGDERMKTYFFNRQNFVKWLARPENIPAASA
jgi:hypothetical protein